MAITIELPSGERVSVSKDIAVFGSDERSDVRLAGLEPRHAQIRKVASRWLIESLGAWTLRIRNGDAARMAWLRSEDLITLTPGGVRIIFEPKAAVQTPRTSVVERKSRKEPPPLPRTNGSDRAPSSEDGQDRGLSSNEVRNKPRTTPPPLPSERAKSKPPSPESVPQFTHPASARPKTTPPPLPSEGTNGGTTAFSGPPPLPSSRTKFDGIRNALGDLTETTKAAGHLAFAEARKATLTNITLPSAYLALGHDIFAGGRFRSEFPEIYSEIERLQATIVSLTTGRGDGTQGGTFAEKAKEKASKIKDMARAKALGMTKTSLIRGLGKVGYSMLEEKSGHELLVRSINGCLEKIEEVDQKLQEHSAGRQGGVLTPKWLLCGFLGTVLVVTVLFAHSWLSRSPQSSIASTNAIDAASPKPTGVSQPTPVPLIVSKPRSEPADFSNPHLRNEVNGAIAQGMQVYRLDAVGLFPEGLPYEIYAYVKDATIRGMSVAPRTGNDCATVLATGSGVSFDLKEPSPYDPSCTYILLHCGDDKCKNPTKRPTDLTPPPGPVFFVASLGIDDRKFDRIRIDSDNTFERFSYFFFLEPQQKLCQYKRYWMERTERRRGFEHKPVSLGLDSEYQTCTVTRIETAPAR
jgi:hypothetical protein